jgi:hypothetical protein
MVVKLESASNCSDGPNSRPQLFMKPFVSRFIGESTSEGPGLRDLWLTRTFGKFLAKRFFDDKSPGRGKVRIAAYLLVI